MDLNALASLLAAIKGQYPKAQITSGYRGPDNPLTQQHPRSFHAQGSPEDPRAVDVAPIPGVNFEDYVSSIKQAGVPIREAFDEAKHPFPWTTGPNWHLASGDAQVQSTRKPMTLGGMMPRPDLGPPAPVDMTSQPMAAPQSLATLAGSMPQGKVPDHKGLFHGKDLAAILGILGDAMSAYGGGQPTFGPAMYKKQADKRQEGFDREKLAAMIEAKRAEAAQPPQYVQNAMAWAQMGPEQRRMVLEQQDAVNPISVAMPDGPHQQPRTQVKRVGDKTYYSIGGEWYEEGE